MGKGKEKIIFCILLAMLFSGCCMKCMPENDYKYNYYEKKWEQASPESKLKYNPYEKEWGFEW